MGKVYAVGTFEIFETYNVVAFLHLVRLLEKKLKKTEGFSRHE